MIYFPYDIRSIGVETKEKDKKINEICEFEFKAERFCFENAEGIIHKGNPDELDFLRKDVLGENLKIVPLRLNFQPYCSKDFIVPINKDKLSKKDKEIHIVYIGSIGGMGFTKDNYVVQCCEAFVKNKIHFHLYMKSNSLSIGKVNDSLSNDFKDFFKSKYFHLHNPLGPKEIINEISKYDYGLYVSSARTPKNSLEKGLLTIIGNKIASYFEAGIPFVYDNGLVLIDELMKKYGLDLGFCGLEEISKMKKKLKKTNYDLLEKNVIKAREDFLMEKNFPRLEKFIDDVVKKQ